MFTTKLHFSIHFHFSQSKGGSEWNKQQQNLHTRCKHLQLFNWAFLCAIKVPSVKSQAFSFLRLMSWWYVATLFVSVWSLFFLHSLNINYVFFCIFRDYAGNGVAFVEFGITFSITFQCYLFVYIFAFKYETNLIARYQKQWLKFNDCARLQTFFSLKLFFKIAQVIRILIIIQTNYQSRRKFN